MESCVSGSMGEAMGRSRSGQRWAVRVPVGAARGAAGGKSCEGRLRRCGNRRALTISCVLARKGGKGGKEEMTVPVSTPLPAFVWTIRQNVTADGHAGEWVARLPSLVNVLPASSILSCP